MSSWRGLREALRLLESRSPPVLHACPNVDSQRPDRGPHRIELAAHAEEVAAALHARYADLVELHVGLLPYPGPGRTSRPTGRKRRPRFFDAPRRVAAGTRGVAVALAEQAAPPRISSGSAATVLLHVANHSDVDHHLQTNGVLQTYVVDAGGTVIGGFDGLQPVPLIVFTARPGGSVQVPALLGTASSAPEMGYAVPPGTWGFIVELVLGADLGSSPSRDTVAWSEVLPLEVLARTDDGSPVIGG